MRKPLTAHGRIGRQQRPAVFNELFISFWKAIRGFYTGVIAAHTPLLVAHSVERKQDFLGEFASLLEDGIHQVRRGLFETRQV